MKIISIRKKTIFKASAILLFTMIICIFTNSFGMQHYYKVDFSTGLVTATTLNVRSGPGTNYGIVATVKKNEYIRVFAGVGDWYIVQVEGDYVGAVNKKYVKAIYPNSSNSNNSSNNNSSSNSNSTITAMTTDEKEVFDLINNQRTQNGLSAKQSVCKRRGSVRGRRSGSYKYKRADETTGKSPGSVKICSRSRNQWQGIRNCLSVYYTFGSWISCRKIYFPIRIFLS